MVKHWGLELQQPTLLYSPKLYHTRKNTNFYYDTLLPIMRKTIHQATKQPKVLQQVLFRRGKAIKKQNLLQQMVLQKQTKGMG